MALDKAIEHSKEKRKPYRGAKAIDHTCRNHGSCKWCEENRKHKFREKKPIEDDIWEEKTMNPEYEGLIVDDVVIGKSGKSFYIEWAAPKLGFGEITVVLGDDGKLHVYTECMSDEFVSLVLSKIVEHMVREE